MKQWWKEPRHWFWLTARRIYIIWNFRLDQLEFQLSRLESRPSVRLSKVAWTTFTLNSGFLIPTILLWNDRPNISSWFGSLSNSGRRIYQMIQHSWHLEWSKLYLLSPATIVQRNSSWSCIKCRTSWQGKLPGWWLQHNAKPSLSHHPCWREPCTCMSFGVVVVHRRTPFYLLLLLSHC